MSPQARTLTWSIRISLWAGYGTAAMACPRVDSAVQLIAQLHVRNCAEVHELVISHLWVSSA